jgi:sugar/nucleoside kinase (ribokinase family)
VAPEGLWHAPIIPFVKRDLLCIGNAVADTSARPVTKLPGRGKLELIDEIGLNPGGCAVLSAMAAARLGLKSGVGIAVGRDAYGDFLVRRLAHDRVDVSGVRRDPRHQTSSTVVVIGPDSERGFIHVIGASAGLTERTVTDATLRRYRALHLSGYFILPSLDGAPARRLLARASRLGLAISLDTCWDPKRRWHLVTMCLPFVDWYLPSIEEARETFGSRDVRTIAKRALAKGVRRGVILKRGPLGVYALTREGMELTIPAFRVKAVDATGAGDCFDAGFWAGMLRGRPLRDALRLGCAAGALSVSGFGGIGRLTSLAQARRMAGG